MHAVTFDLWHAFQARERQRQHETVAGAHPQRALVGGHAGDAQTVKRLRLFRRQRLTLKKTKASSKAVNQSLRIVSFPFYVTPGLFVLFFMSLLNLNQSELASRL